MTLLDLGVMFSLGLVSSLHCVQMCGPIVLSYSVALESLTRPAGRQFIPSLLTNHLAYNAGRIITYTALGALAGLAGHSMGLLGRLAGFSHAAAIITGSLMIVAGIFLLGIIPSRFQTFLRIPGVFLRGIGKRISAPGYTNRFVLGLMLGFLPCGLIYAALLKAMATGSSLSGAATMLAFGLGTAGALVAIGIFSSAIRTKLNRWGSQVAAVAVMAMGAVLIWRGTMPGIMMMDHMHAHH